MNNQRESRYNDLYLVESCANYTILGYNNVLQNRQSRRIDYCILARNYKLASLWSIFVYYRLLYPQMYGYFDRFFK